MNSYQIPDLLHYLDAFITAGPLDSPQCTLNLSTELRVCECLVLPLRLGNCVGPFPLMTVLGIKLDPSVQVARLPDDNLLALHDMVQSWLPQKS